MKNNISQILLVFSIFFGNSQQLLANTKALDDSENKVVNSILQKFTASENEENQEVNLSNTDKFDRKVNLNNDDNDDNIQDPSDPIKSDVAGIDMMIEENDNKMSAAELVGKAYEAFQMGHYEVALMFYTKAEKLEPRNDDILFGIGVTHHKLGHIDIAKNYYINILELYPNNKFALNNFLNILSYEKPDVALTTLRRLEAAEPTLAIIPAQIAVIYERQEDYKNAIRYFKKANKLDPSNLDYVYNIALILEKIGQHNNAMNLYNRIIRSLESGYKSNVSFREVRTRINKLSVINSK